MRPGSFNEYIAKRFKSLRARRAALINRIENLRIPPPQSPDFSATAQTYEHALEHLAQSTSLMLLKGLLQARITACRELRYFRIDNNLRHSAADPNILNTLLIVILRIPAQSDH